MGKRNRVLSLVLSCALMSTLITVPDFSVKAEETTPPVEITVDGNKATQNPANTFKGYGMVSCNGTSRLLMDYKSENPEKYWEIMNQLFNPKTGMGLNHVKVELGADLNTSTATTPATMRTEDEAANVLRGTDWHIAADAKKINPNVTIDALRWTEPKWISNAFDTSKDKGYEARYKWYKSTIDAVYDTYGLEMDYIDPDRNETWTPEADWIKYFSQHLKSEKGGRFDYSKIKIVASDENASYNLVGMMKDDEALRNAIDVVSIHYNCTGNADMQLMNQTYNKEIWYSEATAPMTFSEYRVNSSNPAGGLAGVHSAIDHANRMINMYYSGMNGAAPGASSGYMTRYEFQPAIAAFYDGGQYNAKMLMAANTPWSGYYYSDSGVQMVRHFMSFVQKGWKYVDDACYGDGSGVNNLSNTTKNYLTLCDTNTGDYSMILTNENAKPRNYKVTVKNLAKSGDALKVWETKGPDKGQAYDANWMKHVGDITPTKNSDGSYTFEYSVKPYSIATLTTTSGQSEYQRNPQQEAKNNTILPLPYTDDFEYKADKYAAYKDAAVKDSAKQGYLESRGNAPRYTNDIGGAFEVNKGKDNNTLKAMIDGSTHANGEWNGKPGNDTVLGDDRWANYEASIDFLLDTATAGTGENYAGIAARNLITSGGDNPGYTFKVFADGSYKLLKCSEVKASGKIDGFDNTKWHKEAIKVADKNITAYVDGKEICSFESGQYMSGKVGITSGYYHTQFDNLKVKPIDGYAPYANRVDNLDSTVKYEGSWTHNTVTGFGNFNRTNSVASKYSAISHKTTTTTPGTLNAFYFYKPSGKAWGYNDANAWSQDAGSYYEVSFKGPEIVVYAEKNSGNGTGNIYLDGELVGDKVSFNSSNTVRAAVYKKDGLDPDKVHTIKVAEVSGFISAAGVEVVPDGYVPGVLSYNFTGTGVNLVGNTGEAKINVSVDGKEVDKEYSVTKTGDRATSYTLRGLENGNHNLQVKLVSGSYTVDAIETLNAIFEANDAALSDITIDGKHLDGFAKDKTDYSVTFAPNTTKVPTVAVSTSDPDAKAVVTQAAAMPGTAKVTVTSPNGKVVKDYTIVLKSNMTPVLEKIGNKTIEEGKELSFALAATDANGDKLTYSVSGLPEGASFDAATKVFKWTPAVNKTGDYKVKFTVSDGELTAEEEITISVILVQNDATLSNITLDGKNLDGFDKDKADYSVNLKSDATKAPAVAAVSSVPGVKVEVTQAEALPGTAKITVTALDGKTVKTYTVKFNRTPVLEAIGNKAVEEGKELSFTLAGKDADNDKLTFSASGLPEGASFDAATKVFKWTPAYNKTGDYKVKFAVSDGTVNASEEITITVKPEQISIIVDGKTITGTKDDVTASIKNADQKAKITLDVAGNKVIDKNVFDAFKGTDKTVTFRQNGVEWSFNGKDITNETKAIDMTVNVAAPKDTTSPDKTRIYEKFKNDNALVINFAENGTLPGKAKVRVKLNSDWAKANQNGTVNVYYYNSKTNGVEVVAKNLKVDADGYVEYEITHNSDYIVTNKDLLAANINDQPTNTTPDKNTKEGTNSTSSTAAQSTTVAALPKTGEVVDFKVLLAIGVTIMAAGLGVLTIKKRKVGVSK